MPTKKGQSKKTQKKNISLEEQIENLEYNMDQIENVIEKKKKEEKEEEQREIVLEEKIAIIRNDLKSQLLNQGKIGKHFDDMIEDYIYFVKMKDKLQYDIDLKGLRYETMTGNGYITEKENKSPDTLIKTNNQMLKILQVLDLKEPEGVPEVGDGKDDLL